jgi:hypothetical protein
MPRDILSEYGPDSANPQTPSATCGGVLMKDKVDVMGYRPPTGPIGLGRNSVGLGGKNYGNCGTQGERSARGGESGSVGLGGDNQGMGSNRKG